MDSVGTETAHCPDLVKGCGRRQCGPWGCRERQRERLSATAAAAQQIMEEDRDILKELHDGRPVGVAGGAYRLDETEHLMAGENGIRLIASVRQARIEVITASYMALAASHMATTKALERLVAAGRKMLGTGPSSNTPALPFLEALMAAEKDLGL